MTNQMPFARSSRMMRGLPIILMSALWSLDAFADCGTAPFSVAQPVVERFVLRPFTLLQDFPEGGEDMENRVALIAGSSRAALRPLLGSLTRANQRQREAIAIGFVNAARNCERTRLASARHIERMVRASGNQEFIRNFSTQYKSSAAMAPVAPRLPAPKPLSPAGGGLVPGIRPDPGGNDIRPMQPIR